MSKQFPATLIQGDTLQLTISSPTYNSLDGYNVVVYLTGPSGTPIPYTFTTTLVTGSTNNYELLVTAAVAVGFRAGLYAYNIVATDGTNQFTIESGNTTAVERADFTSSTELRTTNQIILDSVTAVIQNRATQDQKSYTINGRSLERMAIQDLLDLMRYYTDLVAQEQGRTRNKLNVSMRMGNR